MTKPQAKAEFEWFHEWSKTYIPVDSTNFAKAYKDLVEHFDKFHHYWRRFSAEEREAFHREFEAEARRVLGD